MGESKTQYFSGNNRVIIFWNLEDYPISSSGSAKFESMYNNIYSGLDKMGCYGSLQLGLFGVGVNDIKPPDEPLVFYEPRRGEEGRNRAGEVEGKHAADWNISYNILQWIHYPSVDFVVLAKEDPESEVFRVLRILKKFHKFNLFLLEPPPDSTAEDLFTSVDSFVESIQRF